MPALDDSLAAKIRARLDAVDWDDVRGRLATYAQRRLGRRDPELAEDLVQRAIAQVYDTRRLPWDPATEPDVLYVLGGIVNGLASNERRRRRRGREVSVSDEVLEAHPAWETPEQLLAHEEERRVGFGLLKAEVANDHEAVVVVDLFAQGVVRAGEQQKESGLPLAEIRKARRRVFRAMDAIERQREDAGGGRSRPEVA